jgi:hypothetical protein
MRRNPIQDIKRSTPSIHKDEIIKNPTKPKAKVRNPEPEIVTQEKITVDYSTHAHEAQHFPAHSYTRNNSTTNIKLKTFSIIFGIIIIFIGVYFLSLYFGHATVYVTHKKETFTFKDKPFKAVRTSQNDLAFEVMVVADSVTKEATFTESKDSLAKAKGIAVIYNAFSTAPQKLTINTRLADDKNNIYLTDKAITIPGYTTVKGKVVPGSVSVGITASVAGDKYNGEPRDFTIVGFKGTAKATKIYARSKGPITGGSTGLMYTPTPEQKGELSTAISTELRSKLEKTIQAQVPPDYLLFKDSLKIDLNFNPDSIVSSTANAQIKAEGTATALILNERDFEKNVISTVNPNIKADEIEEVSIPELNDFVFKLAPDSESINKQTLVANFTLTGDGTLAWKPNYEKLIASLVGVKKEEVNSIFLNDPGIETARLVLTPVWQNILPKNPKYIKIKQE